MGNNQFSPKRAAIQISEGIAGLVLTRGYIARIDNHMVSYLTQWNWSAVGKDDHIYGTRIETRPDGKKRAILLHREIMNRALGRELDSKEEVDHVDTDTMNNCLSNLRLADRTENMGNQRLQRKSTSGLKGVCWHKGAQKWMARINYKKKAYHLGLFETPEQAHAAYRRKAVELFGSFARFE